MYSLPVNCPIVRDNTAADSVAGIRTAFVKVRDVHPTSNVTCVLVSYRTDVISGSRIVDMASASSSGSSYKVQTLNFSDLASSDRGYYHLECKIPPYNGLFSGIVMYGVEEK